MQMLKEIQFPLVIVFVIIFTVIIPITLGLLNDDEQAPIFRHRQHHERRHHIQSYNRDKISISGVDDHLQLNRTQKYHNYFNKINSSKVKIHKDDRQHGYGHYQSMSKLVTTVSPLKSPQTIVDHSENPHHHLRHYNSHHQKWEHRVFPTANIMTTKPPVTSSPSPMSVATPAFASLVWKMSPTTASPWTPFAGSDLHSSNHSLSFGKSKVNVEKSHRRYFDRDGLYSGIMDENKSEKEFGSPWGKLRHGGTASSRRHDKSDKMKTEQHHVRGYGDDFFWDNDDEGDDEDSDDFWKPKHSTTKSKGEKFKTHPPREEFMYQDQDSYDEDAEDGGDDDEYDYDDDDDYESVNSDNGGGHANKKPKKHREREKSRQEPSATFSRLRDSSHFDKSDDGDVFSKTYIPGTLTKHKYETLGTHESVQLSRQSHITSQNNNQALAHAHARTVMTKASCKWPKPKIEKIQKDPSKTYVPRCTILHRCADDTGCCPFDRQTCVAKHTKTVDLYFFVNTLGSRKGAIERHTFVNHTECECVDRSMYASIQIPATIRRATVVDCKCPGQFETILQDDGFCRCDCSSGNIGCDWLKQGMEHFSMADRKCIMEGRCRSPTCEYGSYIRKLGRCPRKDDKVAFTRTYH